MLVLEFVPEAVVDVPWGRHTDDMDLEVDKRLVGDSLSLSWA